MPGLLTLAHLLHCENMTSVTPSTNLEIYMYCTVVRGGQASEPRPLIMDRQFREGCCYVHKVVYKICRFSMYTKLVYGRWLAVMYIVNGQQSVHDSVIYFIHQMAIHNAIKLLPLTSKTKLTLTVTLTLIDTVTVIF